jgi:hypothetical protein
MREILLSVLGVFCFYCFATENIHAQSAIDKRIDLDVENKTLVEIIYYISKEYSIDFYFEPNSIPYFPYTRTVRNKQLWSLFQDLLNGTSLKALPHTANSILLIQKDKMERAEIDTIVAKWKDGRFKYPFDTRNQEIKRSFGEFNPNASSKSVEYQLALVDKNEGWPIIGAVVRNDDLSVNGITDVDGLCVLRLSAGSHQLLITYTGYQGIDLNFNIYEDASDRIQMDVQSFLLDEVEIVGFNAQDKIDNARAGVEVLNIGKLEVVPQVMGETDIIKSLEMLPGVTSVGEISSGFNVRGGNIDESLVLLNDGIIFNPTHVIGFISAFNADAIQSATLYKGYVDGQFGNRSSAVLDLTTGAGEKEKIKGKGGIGTSVMRLMLEGPISKKLSFQVAGRGSFSDYLLDQVPNLEIQNSSAQFYDGNLSLRYQMSDNHRIDLNGYLSHDFFEYNREFGFEWDNSHLGVKWLGSWSDQWYSSVSLNYGSYYSKQFTLNTAEATAFETDISYYKMLASVTRSMGDRGFLRAGVEWIDYGLAPDILTPTEGSVINGGEVQRKASVSLSPFLTLSREISDRLTVEGSIRWSNYYSEGPGSIYLYGENVIESFNIVDTLSLEGRDPEGSYQILEPRLSVNYKLNSQWSAKGGFNKLSQNVQLISISNTALPTDYWIFSDRYTRPQEVSQWSLGFFHNDASNRFNLSVEGFYKKFNKTNVLRNFPRIILNDHVETELTEANGESYGIEWLFERTKGRINGSIAYTFSRTTRQTLSGNNGINNGLSFPSDFDIPHQLNVLAVYQWLPSFSINFAYVYKSGRPITIPEATILQDNFVLPIYSERNQARIPNYQRLDVSMTLDLRNSKQSGFRSSFSFGLYNLLGRENAFNVFFRRSAKGNVVPFKFSLIGSTVPSVSWNFIF